LTVRLTARGAVVLSGAVVLLVLGVALNLPLLRALAGTALGAVALAFVPTAGKLRLGVTRAVHPDRVDMGQPAFAELVVRNRTHSRRPGFTALDEVGSQVRPVPVRSLPPGGSARYRYELPTTRRGRIPIGPLTVERADLLGLVGRRQAVGGETHVWVHPRRHPVRLAEAGRARHHHEGAPPPHPMAGAMDLRALRPYVPGDELRHLHWKATARTGQLIVREYVDPAQPWCVVVLDTRRDVLDADAFEAAVEVVASVLWAAAEQDRPVRLAMTSGLVLDVRSGTTGLRAAADQLCLVGQDTAAALDLATVGARLGDGWFVHVGGPPGEAVAVQAARYAEAIAFDVSAAFDLSDTAEPAGGLLTIRERDAAQALRRWNATVPR
jgi:uncharacterized protein (DUF58 family)